MFASILKVIIFSVVLLGVAVASLVGLGVITVEEMSIFYDQSKDYIEKEKDDSDLEM